MSKEEILDSVPIDGSTDPLYTAKMAKEAMDIHAKEVAIGFKDWLDKRSRLIADEFAQMPVIVFSEYLTNEQLYQQYLNQRGNDIRQGNEVKG